MDKKSLVNGLARFVVGIAVGLLIAFVFVHPTVRVESVGSGNISLVSSVRKADICKVSATNTTTLCTFLNSDQDQQKRVVNSVIFYSDSLTFPGAASVVVGTSTVAGGAIATTNLLGSTALTSSTAAGYLSTSTYATATARTWNYNEYVIASTTATVTTTGFIVVSYDKSPTQ